MLEHNDMTWCPGCGNFIILKTIHKTINEKLKISTKDYVIVAGIGQASKLPHHMQPCNGFAGLHGRSIPNAIGIKLVNPDLKVIIFSGDGELLAEGGNHLIHAIRRNISICCFLHDNQVFALTKGQASPTMWRNSVTSIQYEGVKSAPINPLPMALVLGSTFIARVSVSNHNHMASVMEEAIKHEGFSLVQILQTCPSFNKSRNLNWYKENTIILDNNYDRENFELAIKESSDCHKKIKLGIFYQKKKTPYEKSFSAFKDLNLLKKSLNFKFSKDDLSRLISFHPETYK